MIRILLIPILMLLATAGAQTNHPQPLSEADYQQTLEQVRPGVFEDAYALIPWQTDLWTARELAAKQGKPILLWEMDGHPLGCG